LQEVPLLNQAAFKPFKSSSFILVQFNKIESNAKSTGLPSCNIINLISQENITAYEFVQGESYKNTWLSEKSKHEGPPPLNIMAPWP